MAPSDYTRGTPRIASDAMSVGGLSMARSQVDVHSLARGGLGSPAQPPEIHSDAQFSALFGMTGALLSCPFAECDAVFGSQDHGFS